jgi:membrane protein implicated in regulation of membrane protease activity
MMLAGLSSTGWAGIGILALIILVALAFWPARVARRKGHSWLLFFIFSLFLFFPALIVAYVMPNRRRRERREERREERQGERV